MFPSFFMGGFECSTHVLRGGKRLDLVESTQHDRFAHEDYQRLKEQGIQTVRDGTRWHRIESRRGRYHFSSLAPLVDAANAKEMVVIWDLLHFGWPDHYDIFSAEFVPRFVDYVRATAEWLLRNAQGPFWFTPVNEISFVSWAGGSVGYLNPHALKRGMELKVQLVRCALSAMGAIRDVIPDARFTLVDPLIHCVPTPGRAEEVELAVERNESTFEAWNMLRGKAWPQLGGDARQAHLIGVNFYPHNQWLLSEEGRDFLRRSHPSYKPFREMLVETYARFQTPLYVSETGTEDEDRVPWFRYVCEETAAAMEQGVPIEGICLYPIVNHPGWDNDRHCYNGLWDYAGADGNRDVYEPLLAEIHRWQPIFEERRHNRLSSFSSIL